MLKKCCERLGYFHVEDLLHWLITVKLSANSLFFFHRDRIEMRIPKPVLAINIIYLRGSC